MSITIQNPTVFKYTATGSTVFQVDHVFFDETDLKVYVTEPGENPNPSGDVQVIGSDYTVTGGNAEKGTVVFVSAPTTGALITIWVDIPDTRTYDFIGANFDPDELNAQLDKLTFLIQQEHDTLHYRGLLYGIDENLSTGNLSLPKLEAGYIWKADGSGNLVAALDEEDPGATTLRSELLSQTQTAPGTDNIGVYDLNTLTGMSLTSWINNNAMLPFDDNLSIIKNVTDNTKQLVIDVHNVTSDKTAIMLIGNDFDTYWNGPVLYRDLTGLQCSSASADPNHDILVSTGHCNQSSENIAFPIILRTSRTKQADATWAVGNAGGMASGVTLSPSQTYYIFALGVQDARGFPGGSIPGDVGFDTDIDATNLLADAVVIAAGYNIYRRIGSFITDGSNNIRHFDQYKDYFRLRTPVIAIDHATGTITPAAQNYTLPIPNGIVIKAKLNISIWSYGNPCNCYFYSPDQTDYTSYDYPAFQNRLPSFSHSVTDIPGSDYLYFNDEIITNTARQIRGVGSFSGGSLGTYTAPLQIFVLGWTDLFINE